MDLQDIRELDIHLKPAQVLTVLFESPNMLMYIEHSRANMGLHSPTIHYSPNHTGSKEGGP